MKHIERAARMAAQTTSSLFDRPRIGSDSGCFLFGLSALGAAQFFAGQFFVKRLATIDADLAAFIFSAHA
jgi:hypothetical protein